MTAFHLLCQAALLRGCPLICAARWRRHSLPRRVSSSGMKKQSVHGDCNSRGRTLLFATLTMRVTARGMPQGLRLRQTQQLVRHCAVSGCFQGPGSLPAGLRPAGRRQLCSMEEFILPCLPERCAGSFDAENVLLPGLRQLRQRDGGIDCRDTLRRHLDNKWNASKTAQELHLRRSSGGICGCASPCAGCRRGKRNRRRRAERSAARKTKEERDTRCVSLFLRRTQMLPFSGCPLSARPTREKSNTMIEIFYD